MLSVTSAQLSALLVTWLYPLARVLGLMSVAPLFGNQAVPRRIRLAAGLAVTFALVGALPAAPEIDPGSYIGIAAFAMQILIGVGMGMVMRVVFAATDVAGEIIGMEMGLSFATFFDPQSQGQTSVIAEFIGLLTALVFLSFNGHLLLIDVLARSFEWLPVDSRPLAARGWMALVSTGMTMFAAGVLLSLPIVAALLITNIALGVLTRAAPQLNIFSLGFPITCTIGFLLLLLSMNVMAPVLQSLFDRGFDLLAMVLKAWHP
ncbi:flagellar biosynthetic protein FliR [Uliginosibacterium sp. sgz301328]|uniref:flagellar biosynthetic protein FliR n=1 Tax=Uliginosibacterium sp. sgz301328 TaxID=3243764 RepID=UPI00359E39FB